MAPSLSLFLVLFGVIALALGQVKDDDKPKERKLLLSEILRPGDAMKDTKPLEQGDVDDAPEVLLDLTEDDLADLLSQIEEAEETSVGRVKRQAGGGSVLNTGPGRHYTNLGTRRDRNGGSHSLLGHYQRQASSYGLGYQYGTPNGRSAVGAGLSNGGFRVGGRHSWTSGRNGRLQHSLGGSYGYNRRGGHSAGLTYRLRFRRAALQAN